MKFTDFELFEPGSEPGSAKKIDFATYKTVGVSARVLDAVAGRTGIDRSRINFTPTFFSAETFIPQKAFVFEGRPTDFVWTPEIRAPLEADVADAEAVLLNDVIERLVDYLKDVE